MCHHSTTTVYRAGAHRFLHLLLISSLGASCNSGEPSKTQQAAYADEDSSGMQRGAYAKLQRPLPMNSVRACSLEIRAYRDRFEGAEPLLRTLDVSARPLLRCANKFLYGLRYHKPRQVRFETDPCNHGRLRLSENGTYRGSDDPAQVNQFATCALSSISKYFPNSSFHLEGTSVSPNGPCIALGYRSGIYEILIPEEACHFDRVNVAMPKKTTPSVSPSGIWEDFEVERQSSTDGCADTGLQSGVESAEPKLRQCYKRRMTRENPYLREFLQVEFDLSRGEESTKVDFVEPSGVPGVKVCLEQALSDIEIRQPDAECRASYSIFFTSAPMHWPP